MEMDQVLFYVISELLQYPDQRWEKQLQVIKESFEETGLPELEEGNRVERFLALANEVTLDQMEQIYIQLFDFGKKTNLYLSYGTYGEERERGPVLLSLKQIYEEAGLEMTEQELSDYLPLVLEFAATAHPVYAARIFGHVMPGIRSLHEALMELQSPYSQLTGAALSAAERVCRSVESTTSLVARLQEQTREPVREALEGAGA